MTKVAVYGSLRNGMGNHGLLVGQKYVGTTVTVEPFAMYSLGAFPKVSLKGERVCPIVVEIYEVDEKGLLRLDQLEGYRGNEASSFYNRSPVETGLGEALIYHIEGDNRRESHLVTDGDWVNFCKQRGSRY